MDTVGITFEEGEEREKAIWRPPEEISLADWAEKYHELNLLSSATAGRFILVLVPYLRPIFDALDDPHIETVVVQKASQVAGTEAAICFLGKIASNDPGPAMFCFADEDTAIEVCERRIQPMFRRTLFGEESFNKKIGQNQIILPNGFSLTMAWASSIAKTASRPIRYLILDEITKPGYSLIGQEGSPIERIIQRTATFRNRKILLLSTPTTEGDAIDKQMMACDVVYEWCVPCPACGKFQPLRYSPQKVKMNGVEIESGCIVWPEDLSDDKERVKQARYRCAFCKKLWTTVEKNLATQHGKAIPRDIEPTNIKRKGFFIPRICTLFPSGDFEALAADFLSCKDDPLKLQIFINNALGEHWKDKVQGVITPEVLEAKLPELKPHSIPEEAVVLTAGIDVQYRAFFYVVRAWAQDYTSWLIDYGTMPDWEHLERLLFGNIYQMPIGRALIDIGGSYREGSEETSTEEVYHWLYENGRGRGCPVWGCKGASRPLAGRVRLGSIIERTPSGKRIPGGLQLVIIDTDKMKDQYWYRIARARKRQSRGAYLHCDVGDDYAMQVLAEEKRRNRKGIEEWVRIRPDNHYLDAEIYCHACVEPELFGGLRIFHEAQKPNVLEESVQKAQKPEKMDEKPKPTPKKPIPMDNPWLKGVLNPFKFGGNR